MKNRNPLYIFFSAIILLILILSVSQPASAQDEETVTVSGWFNIIWGDSQNGQPSAPVYTVTDDAGLTSRLNLDPALTEPLGGVLLVNHKRVTVAAVQQVSALGEGAPVLDVKSIALDGEAQAQADSVNGTKKFVSIMCKFSNYSVEPQSQAYFDGMYSASYPGLDDYWQEISYDIANINGSDAYGWYTLPNPQSYYVYNGALDFDRAANDCTAVANPYVDFSDVYGINLMFNYELDGYAWGGSQYMTLDGVTKSWPMTWEPPWGYTDIAVIAHEMGHAFGLPHSTYNPVEVYDNQWDMMSDSWSNCFRLNDPTYGCLAQHTISYHKDMLGWIGAGKYTAAYNTQAVITLEQLALPQTSNYKMAQIPILGSATHFYTVEVRRQTGYDYKLPGQAVIIHEVTTSLEEPAHVIDSDGNGDTGDAGAMWTVGETFSANSVTVTVQSATATGFQVYIKNGSNPPPGAFNKSAPSTGAADQSVNAVISWGASAGAASYEYCVNTSASCSTWTPNGASTSKTLALQNDTTYYWHVRAIGSTGLITYANGSSSALWSFTTVPSPPEAFSKTLPANNATGVSTSPTLSWGTSAYATYYEYCYYKDGGSCVWTPNLANTSKTLSGLYGGELYSWHVRAGNGAGTIYSNGDSSAFWSFTTRNLSSVSAAPSPATVGMDADTQASITYNFTETAGGSGTITSYTSRFYTLSDTPLSAESSGAVNISISPYQNSAWADTITLPADVVAAARAAGQSTVVLKRTFSGTSPDGTFTAQSSLTMILPPDAFAKTSPADSVNTVPVTATLQWGASIGASSYQVCYNTTTTCSSWSNASGTSLTVSLQPNTSYYWQVRAVNSLGTFTYADADVNSRWQFTTLPGEDAYEIDNTSAQAKWIYAGSPQIHNIKPAGDVDWVKFELTKNSSVTLETSGSTAADTIIHLYSSANLTTYIEMDDDDGAGNYSYINRACGATALPAGIYYVKVSEYYNTNIIPDYTLTFNAAPCFPDEPGNFAVSGATVSSVSLTWQDNSSNESGFKIYRWKPNTSGVWSFMLQATVGANVSTYTDTGLTCGTEYRYKVSAYNAYGESNLVGEVAGSTSPCPPGAFDKSSPANEAINQPLSTTLSWTSSALSASYEYCYTKTLPCLDWKTDAGANTSVNLTGLDVSSTYYWQARARNPYDVTYADSGAYWTFRTGEPPAPFGRISPLNGSLNQPFNLTLRWFASDGVTPTTDYEYCLNTTDACATWTNVGSSTLANISGLKPVTVYYWQVRAVNPFGETLSNAAWGSFQTAPLKMITYPSASVYDGWALESSEFSNTARSVSAIGKLRVGDDSLKRQFRSIVSFNTAALPDNAVISKVTLRIHKAGSTSPSPFLSLGDLVADMKKGYFGTGASLTVADFSAAGERINTAGSFTSVSGNWYQLSVSPAHFQYINLTGVTQFRLRFTKDDNNNKLQDLVQFDSGGDVSKPQLVIEYIVP